MNEPRYVKSDCESRERPGAMGGAEGRERLCLPVVRLSTCSSLGMPTPPTGPVGCWPKLGRDLMLYTGQASVRTES